MRHSTILAVLLLAAALPACNKDEATTPPVLGTQIDRVGRPGVNTALTDPFDLDSSAKGTTQDTYNAASDPGQWRTLFSRRIAGSLAVFDSLDGVCGNQLLAGTSLAAGRYDALADVLADDQLYVDTASGTCTTYLGVEANAAGVSNGDCGGRTPVEDAIDRTYSVLAAGSLAGVGDGADKDADATHSTTTFPFLAAPLK